MRIDRHFEKINSLEGTLGKLDDSEDLQKSKIFGAPQSKIVIAMKQL